MEEIKNRPISISQWILGFIGIFFVRYIFESLSSPTTLGIIPSDPYTLIHVGLFFLTTVLGLICVIGYWSKDYAGAQKVILFGLPVIWLAPILDIIISFGHGYRMTYIFDTSSALIFDFLTFFGPRLTHGATYGIRIEIIIILLLIGWYVWLVRKNLFHSLLAVLSSYILIFSLAAIPGFVYTLSHLNTGAGDFSEVLNYLVKIISQSNIAHNTLHDGNSFVSGARLFELGFDKFLSQILFILSFIFTAILFWKMEPKKTLAVIKNSRPERVAFYILLLLFGAGLAYANGYGNLNSWVDVMSLLTLVLSWYGAWMYAVHVNDVADIEIDKISNTTRPLVSGALTKEEMNQAGYVWLAVSLVGSWSVGFYPFFMNLVYVATSYIYSSPPLRLRRVPVLSSFLISLACLVTVLTGFFFISADKKIETFPIFTALGVLIVFTLITNIRDLKDTAGDRANGVQTLATFFGKNAGKVIGLCFAVGILLVPIFLSFYILYLTAIPTAIMGYGIIVKKPFTEKNVFILGFLFFLSAIIMAMFI